MYINAECFPYRVQWIKPVSFFFIIVHQSSSFVSHHYKSYNFIFTVLAASPDDPIKIMKDELKQQYHRKFSHVSPVPWNQHFIVELENIYTNVKVISVPKGQRGSVHIPDILRYSSLSDKCMITKTSPEINSIR